MYITFVESLTKTLTTMTTDKTTILNEWYEVANVLKEAKAKEAQLRMDVIAEWYPAHKDEGTENVDLDDGYKLNCVFKQNYEFDKERDFSFDLEGKAGTDLVELFNLLNGNPDLDDTRTKLFDVKVTVNASVFKKLAPSIRAIVEPFITIKDATPSLKIVEPKEGK